MMLCLKSKTLIFQFVFLYLTFVLGFSQELPPTEVFSIKDYNAGNQNWSIAQADDETIYIANNKGLLEYNGARWNLHANQDQTIVRSVAFIDSKVYMGSYMDFGYWERNIYGQLEYTSLAKTLEEDLIQDEEFWAIISLDDWILFQSLDRIYIYNTASKKMRIIDSDYRITKMYKVSGVIYFQRLNDGIYKIENGKDILVANATVLKEQEVINIFDYNNQLLVHTAEDGFFLLKDGAIKKWQIEANSLLSSLIAYSSIRLRNGNFIVGTISNGLVKLDKNGKLLFKMNQYNGLSNNTVLSLFQDISGNIWVGLDNGVNTLNLDSPYRVYNDEQGKLGTIYASIKTSDYLYLGTNQGLFYRPIDSTTNFDLIPGTKGQVWTLKKFGSAILCGHHSGTFQIFENRAVRIASEKGTWDIKEIQGHPGLLIQGNYKGLAILEKQNNNQWSWKSKVEGFGISSRYFEFVNPSELLVSHEYKGVYRIKLNKDFTKVDTYQKERVSKGIGSSLFKYRNNIFYAFQEGIFRYQTDKFVKDGLLASYFSDDNYVSGKLINDPEGHRLWSFFKNQIVCLEPGNLTDKPTIRVIDLPSNLRKSKSGFENILQLRDNVYLFGTTEGYIIIDLGRFQNKNYEVNINHVSFNELNKTKQSLNPNEAAELKNSQNNIHLSYSVADFSSLYPSWYQYRLIGIYDDWSDWSEQSFVYFENLPHNHYTFEVRAKVGGNVSNNIAKYSFSIEKPWYLKTQSIVGYVLLFIVLALAIQYFNTKHYKKQKAKLIMEKERELEFKEIENQRQLVEFKNKNLQQDIENKNRELGLSTMNLIRKNEFLNTIKRELQHVGKVDELNEVIKIIDKNINNTEDWKYFEEAFNNADKDFLKKMKALHPSLTPNDLKLCAYLRLNLASKEIAPLLNISHRSVEVKRYRLRKKMDLPHEASLTNYILEV